MMMMENDISSRQHEHLGLRDGFEPCNDWATGERLQGHTSVFSSLNSP